MTRYRRIRDFGRLAYLGELIGAAVLGAGVYLAVVLAFSLA